MRVDRLPLPFIHSVLHVALILYTANVGTAMATYIKALADNCEVHLLAKRFAKHDGEEEVSMFAIRGCHFMLNKADVGGTISQLRYQELNQVVSVHA